MIRTTCSSAGLLSALGMFGIVACSSSDTNVAPITADGGGSATTGGTGGSTNAGSGTTGGGATAGGTTGTAGNDDGLVPSDSIWRTTSEWYRPIDAAPVAAHSSSMIGAIAKWGTTGVCQIDFSFNVLEGQGAPQTAFPLEEEADDVTVPIPAKGYIEGDHAYDACPNGDDCHILVLDRAAKKLYEVYHAHKDGNAWSGFVALWKLDKNYPRSNRGQGCTSADAAGMAIMPGLIGYRETKKGAIEHALRLILRNEYIRGTAGDKTVPNVVYPASHGSTAGASAVGLPYGGRLRLKTVTDADPRVKTPGAKAVVRALRKYGMILADGGNLPLTAESAKVANDADATATWDGLLAARDLGFLVPSDFEVVGIPKDYPNGTAGYYSTKADYEAQVKPPLGCTVITQP